jgi:hypothetical protein
MSDDILNDLAGKLEQLSAEDQRSVLAHLDTISSREYMAAEAAKKAAQIKVQRQIEPLEREMNELLKHPSANRFRIRDVKKQLDPLYRELDGLK